MGLMQDVPSAVSFKELSIFLQAASKSIPAEKGFDKMSVSYDWVERTSALLKEIEQSSSAAAEGKTPHQVMALGSFRTHLLLGLQALKAANI